VPHELHYRKCLGSCLAQSRSEGVPERVEDEVIRERKQLPHRRVLLIEQGVIQGAAVCIPEHQPLPVLQRAQDRMGARGEGNRFPAASIWRATVALPVYADSRTGSPLRVNSYQQTPPRL
jgi:hypothetical protein